MEQNSEKKPELDRLWTVMDTADYLNVKKSTIRSWIIQDRIRFHRIGALIRFLPNEIIEDTVSNKVGKRQDRTQNLKLKAIFQSRINKN